MEPKNLLEKDNLQDYCVSELIEVFKVNELGERLNESGLFFFDDDVARGFIGLQLNPRFYGVCKALVLYNQKATRLDAGDVTGFLVGASCVIVAEQPIREEIQHNALKKLTSSEIKLLNIKE